MLIRSWKIPWRGLVSGKHSPAAVPKRRGLEAIQAFTVAARPSSPEQKPEQKLPQTITAKSFTKTYENKAFSLKVRAKTALTYKSSDEKVAVVSSGKTYYYKVRAYKQVGKTKLYGAYSKVKRIKVR